LHQGDTTERGRQQIAPSDEISYRAEQKPADMLPMPINPKIATAVPETTHDLPRTARDERIEWIRRPGNEEARDRTDKRSRSHGFAKADASADRVVR